LQILGVKSFGEPVVDGGQRVTCFVLLALTLPQAGEADGGAQFKGFGLLLLSNFYGLEKVRFGFSCLLP
jgi:hypothetical protein